MSNAHLAKKRLEKLSLSNIVGTAAHEIIDCLEELNCKYKVIAECKNLCVEINFKLKNDKALNRYFEIFYDGSIVYGFNFGAGYSYKIYINFQELKKEIKTL